MSSHSDRWVRNGGANGLEVEEVSHIDGLVREMGGPSLDQAGERDRRLAEAWGRTLAEFRLEALAPVAESSQTALRALYPQELRPTPAFTVLRFEPRAGTVAERRTVPRGTLVPCRPESDRDRGTADGPTLRFTTTAPFELAPLRSTGCRRVRAGDGGVLELALRALEAGPARMVLPRRLRLFASHPHPEGTLSMRGDLLDRQVRVVVEATEASGTVHRRTLPGSRTLRPVGLDTRGVRRSEAESTSLLPWPRRSDEGVRLLQELAVFPLKFAFVDLDLEAFGIEEASDGGAIASLTVRFEGLRGEGSGGELLPFCTPAANLFRWEARPMRFGEGRTDHLITPESPLGPDGEVFSVEEVRSLDAGGATIPRLDLRDAAEAGFEVVRRKGPRGTRCLLRVVGEERLGGGGVAASLLCTDGTLVETHRIARLVAESLPEASVSSVAPISPALPPRDREDACWRLLSLLGGERDERLSASGLRREFEFAIPCAHLAAGRFATSLRNLKTTWRDRIAGRSWVRCCRATLDLDGSEFGGLGEFTLFADVFGAWVRSVAPINTVVESLVEDSRRGWRREGPSAAESTGVGHVR